MSPGYRLGKLLRYGLLLGPLACSSKSSPAPAPSPDASSCPAIRPHAGTPDAHCMDADGGMLAVPVLALECADAGAATLEPDAGVGVFDDSLRVEADDLECKYHVVLNWSCSDSTQTVLFRATVTRRSDGAPAAGGVPYMAAIQGATHPAPNTNYMSPELAPGTYEVGPVDFDRAGAWAMVLHLFEACPFGSPGSPHGETFFDVDVP